MKIFLPHTKIQPATKIALRNYNLEPVKLTGKYGYGEYFKQRWQQRENFINIEHDCVPYPGAIEALENCSSPWCAYDYSSTTNWEFEGRNGLLHSIHLGCMKITKYLIDATVGLWDAPIDWSHCDIELFRAAFKAKIKPHQHFPGIVNANPVLLK